MSDETRPAGELVVVGRSVAVEERDGSLRIKAECHDYIRDLARAFDAVRVVQPVLRWGDPSLDRELLAYTHPLPPGVTIVAIPDDFSRTQGLWASLRRVYRQLVVIRENLRSADAALINMPSYRGIGALVLARLERLPCVAHCAARLHRRSYDPRGRRGWARLVTPVREMIQKVLEVTAVALAPARTVDGPDLLATFRHLPGPTEHSPPIVSFDPETVRSLRAERDPAESAGPTILHVGALVPRKNIDTIIASVAELRETHPDARLVLVGSSSSDHARELEGLAGDLLAEPRACEFTGYVGDSAKKHGYFAQADLLVCASYTEGFPRVIYEALSADIPVVATELPGYRENMPDGAMELVAVGKDPAPLAEGMRRALRQERAEEMRALGGERARAMMSRSAPDLALALFAAQGVRLSR